MRNINLVLLGPVHFHRLQLWEMPPGKLTRRKILEVLWYVFTSIHLRRVNSDRSLVHVAGNSEKQEEE